GDGTVMAEGRDGARAGRQLSAQRHHVRLPAGAADSPARPERSRALAKARRRPHAAAGATRRDSARRLIPSSIFLVMTNAAGSMIAMNSLEPRVHGMRTRLRETRRVRPPSAET